MNAGQSLVAADRFAERPARRVVQCDDQTEIDRYWNRARGAPEVPAAMGNASRGVFVVTLAS